MDGGSSDSLNVRILAYVFIALFATVRGCFSRVLQQFPVEALISDGCKDDRQITLVTPPDASNNM